MVLTNPLDLVIALLISFGYECIFGGSIQVDARGHARNESVLARWRVRLHPIALLGRYAESIDSICNPAHEGHEESETHLARLILRIHGVVALALGLMPAVLISLFWLWCRDRIWHPDALASSFETGHGLWIVGSALIIAPFWATRLLYQHGVSIYKALEADQIVQARRELAHIVGRNSQSLSRHGIVVATIESLAENFSDAVVAPLFWFLLFGLPGLLIYKSINTLDSMWGYLSRRYRYFGWGGARLDDVVNLIPARICAMLFLLVERKLDSAFQVFRFARVHPSWNAGWPEAAMAVLLGLRLGGPRSYPNMTGDITYWIGSGRKRATRDDLRRALRIYSKVGIVLLLMIIVVPIILGSCQWMCDPV